MEGYIIFLIIFLLAFLLVPNGGNPSGIDRISLWLALRNREKEILKHKGDVDFILGMINASVKRRNNVYRKHGIEKQKIFLKEVDPFSTYIFHGLCHGCTRPQEESISGCLNCIGYSFDNELSKFQG